MLVENAQVHLFVFLPPPQSAGWPAARWVTALAANTSSGVTSSAFRPWLLVLPYADLLWTGVLSVVIGLVL